MVETGGQIVVKASHVEVNMLSPDEKFMFARDLAGKGELHPLSGGEAQPIRGWDSGDVWVNWCADGKSVYVYHDDKATAPLFRIDLATGKRQIVNAIPVGSSWRHRNHHMRITRDGKSYAYSYARDLSGLYLVEGVHYVRFRSGLQWLRAPFKRLFAILLKIQLIPLPAAR